MLAWGVLVALVGCGTASDATISEEPSASATASGHASASPSAAPSLDPSPEETEAGAVTATDVLECTGPPSDIGGFANDFGPSAGGASEHEALTAELAQTPFAIPRSGYKARPWPGRGVLYVHEVDGRVKVAIVISRRFGQMVGAPFAIDEIRACEKSEFGPAADLGATTRV